MTGKNEQPRAEALFIHFVGQYGFKTRHDKSGATTLLDADKHRFRKMMGENNNFVSLIQKVKFETLSTEPSEFATGVNINVNEKFTELSTDDQQGASEFISFLFDCITESAQTIQQERDTAFVLRRGLEGTKGLSQFKAREHRAEIMTKKWDEVYLPGLIRPLMERQNNGKNEWIINNQLRECLASCADGIADMMNWISSATFSDKSVSSVGIRIKKLAEILSSHQAPEEIDPRYSGISGMLPVLNERRTSSGDQTRSVISGRGLLGRFAQERVKTLGVKN